MAGKSHQSNRGRQTRAIGGREVVVGKVEIVGNSCGECQNVEVDWR